jgi:predicted transcriptional regulator
MTGRRKLNLMLDADLVERLYTQARHEGRWKSAVVERACREYLERRRPPESTPASGAPDRAA